jgi:hypothetical protein
MFPSYIPRRDSEALFGVIAPDEDPQNAMEMLSKTRPENLKKSQEKAVGR